MAEDKNLVIVDNRETQNMIYTFRGKQVMVDSDLAELYKVTTGNLNKAMERNLSRFPEHFCFQLTEPQVQIIIMVEEDICHMFLQSRVLLCFPLFLKAILP